MTFIHNTNLKALCEMRRAPSAYTKLPMHTAECRSIVFSKDYTKGPSLLSVRRVKALQDKCSFQTFFYKGTQLIVLKLPVIE